MGAGEALIGKYKDQNDIVKLYPFKQAKHPNLELSYRDSVVIQLLDNKNLIIDNDTLYRFKRKKYGQGKDLPPAAREMLLINS